MDSHSIVKDLIAAVEAKDAERFASLMTEDAKLRFGNSPPVHGRANIATFCAELFAKIQSMEHEIVSIDNANAMIVWQGIATHRRVDGTSSTFPHCNLVTVEGGKVKEYLVYADNR